MAKFSKTSLNRLYSCHQDIQKICFKAITIFDFSVLCGYRNKRDQTKAYKQKKSQLQYPNSKHNIVPSIAIDLAPYPIDWEDNNRFIYLAGHLMGIALELNIQLRWGGNWKKDNNLKNNGFNDYAHFELIV